MYLLSSRAFVLLMLVGFSTCGLITWVERGVENATPGHPPEGFPCGVLSELASPVPSSLLRDAEGTYRYYKNRSFYFDGIHLGVDLDVPEGTPVFAGVHGEVQYAGPASGYGNLVVVVETYTDAPKTWTNGLGELQERQQVLFLFGHLRPTELFGGEGQRVQLKAGDCVTPSTVIGYIERDSHNGDGAEHVHYAVRLQSWEEAQKMQVTSGHSDIAGYDRDGTLVAYYGNPEQVLDQLP